MAKVKKAVKNFKKKLAKEEIEELALQEQVEGYVSQATQEQIAVDLSSLPHFAEASGGVGAAGAALLGGEGAAGVGVAGAAAAGLSASQIALGVLALGGVAAIADGGGGGTSDTTADENSDATFLITDDLINNSEKTAVAYSVAGLDGDASADLTFEDHNGTTIIVNDVTADGSVDLSSLADGTITLTAFITDTAGNTASGTGDTATLDTIAPIATISDDNVTYSNSDMTFTFQFSESVSGFDFSDLTVSAGTTDSSKFTKIDDDTYTLVVHSSNNGTNGEITVDIITGSFTDTAGNANTEDTLADTQEYTAAGSTVIDLGSYGKLVSPIFIDNNGDSVADSWFYYWDRSGDGTTGNTGALNGGVDYTTHNVLDGIFNHDINGVTNTTVQNVDGGYGTTNDYRYATLNDVKVALPTQGGGSIGNYLSDNQAYTDWAEIWDTYNSGYRTDGTPSNWLSNHYWTATPSSNGHAGIFLYDGLIGNNYDTSDGIYVAVQVL